MYAKEMKELIKIEKSVLRFRLVLIRNWAFKRLKELRNAALFMYQRLDEWN